MFNIGDRVHVAEPGYDGDVIEIRDNDDGTVDYCVRYTVPAGRKPFYDTWWPASYLAPAATLTP